MSDLTRFRPRYSIIDHENAQTHLVGGPYFVLFPASNFADYAAMKAVVANVDPDMGLSLRQHLNVVDRFPDRTLSKFGIKSIPFVTDPELKPQARAWARRHGIFVPDEKPPQVLASPMMSTNGKCSSCGNLIATEV